jgi:RNA polymerase sigma-70 factor (ECF subfamily)
VQPEGPPTPGAESPSSVETVSGLRSRDPRALRALVEEQIDPLLAFVFHRVDRDRATAEEVVQDTFLAAVQSAPRFRGDSTVFTWLCGIARKIILMRRRRDRRHAKAIPFSDLLLESDEEISIALNRIEEEDLPESLVVRQETRKFVGAVMSTLPPSYQAGLLARYRDGKTLAQLALEAGTTVKGAESLLYRARRAFAESFKILTDRVLGRED